MLLRFAALNILLYYTVDIDVDNNVHHRSITESGDLKRCTIKFQ